MVRVYFYKESTITPPRDENMLQSLNNRTGENLFWGSVSWGITSNSAMASTSLISSTTHALRIRNLGFNLPSNAIVRGIQVRWSKSMFLSVGSTIQDEYVTVNIAGFWGDNKKAFGNWRGNATVSSYGGSNDIWSFIFINPLDINSSSFGVIIQARMNKGFLANSVTALIGLSNSSVRVYYTVPGSGDPGGWTQTSDINYRLSNRWQRVSRISRWGGVTWS